MSVDKLKCVCSEQQPKMINYFKNQGDNGLAFFHVNNKEIACKDARVATDFAAHEDFMLAYAAFGPKQEDFKSLTGDLVLASPANAKTALSNADDIKGKIAVVERGDCDFNIKAKNCQDAGAVAMIVFGTQARHVDRCKIFSMGGDGDDITIPCWYCHFQNYEVLQANGINGLNITISNDIPTSSAPDYELKYEKPGKFLKCICSEQKGKMHKMLQSHKPGEKGGIGFFHVNNPTSVSCKKANVVAEFMHKSDFVCFFAHFGVPKDEFKGLTGDLVLAEPIKANASLTNAAAINGKIAVIERGGCNFQIKAVRAQEAGAVGVLVCGAADRKCDNCIIFGMSGDDDVPAVTIPVWYTHYQNYQVLTDPENTKNGAVNVTFSNDIPTTSAPAVYDVKDQPVVWAVSNTGLVFRNGQPTDKGPKWKLQGDHGASLSVENDDVYVLDKSTGQVYKNSANRPDFSTPFTMRCGGMTVKDGKVTIMTANGDLYVNGTRYENVSTKQSTEITDVVIGL